MSMSMSMSMCACVCHRYAGGTASKSSGKSSPAALRKASGHAQKKDRVLTFDELFEWIMGERHCLDTRQEVTQVDLSSLCLATTDKLSGEPRDLGSFDWTRSETLREELQRMCRDNELTPSELMWHWNTNRDGQTPPLLAPSAPPAPVPVAAMPSAPTPPSTPQV